MDKFKRNKNAKGQFQKSLHNVISFLYLKISMTHMGTRSAKHYIQVRVLISYNSITKQEKVA